MMESSNLNLDRHHQEYFHGSSSSLALQGWNQHLILNSEFPHRALPSSRDIMRTNNDMPMVQELGFQWTPSSLEQDYMMNMNQSLSSSSFSHQTLGFHLPKNNVKEELSIASTINLHDYSFMPFHGSFCNVFPSENVSGSGLQCLYPNLLGMDLQPLDLLASARFGRTMSQSLSDGYNGLGKLPEEAQAQVFTSYHKAPHSVSGVTEAKRSNSLDRGTSQPASLTKKPRFESRSSFTPFKVRKEKLGDRIAALQQLVAPFGKTDTASVLMEAIGYIKFLQDQVETLSVPYMRSLKNKQIRTSKGAESGDEKDETKPDLRSRGLCLVPLSCTSYVTNENGVWSSSS